MQQQKTNDSVDAQNVHFTHETTQSFCAKLSIPVTKHIRFTQCTIPADCMKILSEWMVKSLLESVMYSFTPLTNESLKQIMLGIPSSLTKFTLHMNSISVDFAPNLLPV